MIATGRLNRTLDPEILPVIFGPNADAAIESELEFYLQVDRAHLVMLRENSLIESIACADLLRMIDALDACGYKPLRNRPAPRGLYLLYEGYLIEQLGFETGGILHLGRSRNDLSATAQRLRLRGLLIESATALKDLIQISIVAGERHHLTAIPAYTHYQTAFPSTLGHYLRSLSNAWLRDLEALAAILPGLQICPLGAGAGGGTSVPINSSHSARLLGFRTHNRNSIDAVASRDLFLRFISVLAITGVTLSRVAQDLLLFSSNEFGLLQLPDELLGSSSMLPQKRNPFLLEHVKGRSAASAAALQHALLAMHATPFSNSVAVGTEALGPIWDSASSFQEATLIIRKFLASLEVVEENVRASSEQGYVHATLVAERLVSEHSIPFREAHNLVGRAVTRSEIEKISLERIVAAELNRPDILRYEATFAALEYGSGPGSGSAQSLSSELHSDLKRVWAVFTTEFEVWALADHDLRRSIETILQQATRGTSK